MKKVLSILLIVLTNVFMFSQTEIEHINGLTVDGRERTVSYNASGNIIAIGSPSYNSNFGRVRVLQKVNGVWIPLGNTLTATKYSNFGLSLALDDDGNTLVVGAPNESFGTGNRGRFSIYELENNNWVRKYTALGLSNGRFGISVDINGAGDIAIAGMPTTVQGNGPNVRVFSRDASNVWNIRSLQYSTVGSAFGISVSINKLGDRYAVGASQYSNFLGRVFVYNLNTTTNVSTLFTTITGQVNSSKFGDEVRFDGTGNTLVVGAPNENLGIATGAAYIYENITGTYTQTKKISGVNNLDRTGYALAINNIGDKVAISSYGSDISCKDNFGSFEIYTKVNNSWDSYNLKTFGKSEGNYLGLGMDFNDSGSLLAVSERDNDEFANNAGQVRIFDMSIGTVSFTNIALENYLLADLTINKNNDAFIQITEATNYLGTLNVDNLGLSDLSELAAFKNIDGLEASNNNFTNLDISNFDVLKTINLSNNAQLVTVTLPELCVENLNLSNCALSFLDLSNLTSLINVNLNNNQLTSLNIINGNNTNIVNFDTRNNPNLSCIEVDNIAYSTTNWTLIDATTGFGLNCHFLQTYVPDDNFENYLETHNASGVVVAVGDITSMGNGTANDDYVFTTQINTVNSLQIPHKNIADLTGIEDFLAIQTLNCSNNLISTVDLSHNLDLEDLLIYSCTSLTSLDVTSNVNLIVLACKNTAITELNLSQNPFLENLTCPDNNLTSLNVKNGNNTNVTVFNAFNNPNLICIEVDNATYSTANWPNIDATSTFSSHCPFGETYVPDDNFENYLETHNANGVVVPVGDPTSMGNGIANDDYVTTANINTVLSLDVQSLSISDLTGIEDFTLLNYLDCSSNQLVSIDISQNIALTQLFCIINQLTSLDVSQNTALWEIDCYANQLTTIDVSNNTALTGFRCSANLLTSIDITNNLALLIFNCKYNQIATLDITHNTLLSSLYFSFNQIVTLDLSQNSDLLILECKNNQLTSLNISQNQNLSFLQCDNNFLTSLDFSQVQSIASLTCDNNQIGNLNLSQQVFLQEIICSNNNLTDLNVKNGYNSNVFSYNSLGNPNLACIEVDNPTYSTTNWSNVDPTSIFSSDCINCPTETTYINTGWTNGIPTLNKCAVIDQDYATTSFSAYKTTVNTSKTLTIIANTYMEVLNEIVNDGTITIEPTGSVVQINNNASVTGSGIFNTKIATTPLQDQYRTTYFSSPSVNETLNVFSSWGDMGYLWGFDEITQIWNYLNNTATPMQAGNGYIMRGNSSNSYPNFIGLTTFQNAYNNGIITQSLHFKGDGSSTANVDNDNNLIGNPYPSAIDGTKLLNQTLNPTAGTLYFWTHNSAMVNGNFSTDDYAMWNLSGGTAAVSGGTAPTGYIASGQGFFIEAEGNENLPLGQDVVSTLTFNNDMRETGNNTDFRSINNSKDDKIWLNLSNDDGVFSQILIAFLPNGTVAYDNAYDGKRTTNELAAFYSIGLSEQHLGIQALPLFQEDMVIPLGYQIGNEIIKNLKISIDHFENMSNVNVYLKDNMLNLLHDLSSESYEFFVTDMGEFNTRFELIFRNNALNLEGISLIEELIISNTDESSILVKTLNGSIINRIEVFDVLGKLIVQVKPNKSKVMLQTANINHGTVLIIKSILQDGTVISKKFVKYSKVSI